MPRSKDLPAGWEGTFFANIGAGMSISKAATAAGVSERTIRYRRTNDPDFADDLTAAMEVKRDLVRDEVWKRAFDDQDPNNSWKALQWLAEHTLPEGKWKSELQLVGGDGGPIKIQQGVATLGEVFDLLRAQGVPLDQAAAGSLTGDAEAEIESGVPDRRALPGPSEVLAEPR